MDKFTIAICLTILKMHDLQRANSAILVYNPDILEPTWLKNDGAASGESRSPLPG